MRASKRMMNSKRIVKTNTSNNSKENPHEHSKDLVVVMEKDNYGI